MPYWNHCLFSYLPSFLHCLSWLNILLTTTHPYFLNYPLSVTTYDQTAETLNSRTRSIFCISCPQPHLSSSFLSSELSRYFLQDQTNHFISFSTFLLFFSFLKHKFHHIFSGKHIIYRIMYKFLSRVYRLLFITFQSSSRVPFIPPFFSNQLC